VSDRVLIVDKPSGPTSHDVVARVRRITGVRRVGHAGTLDPRATGVLVVLVGRATRLSAYLMDGDKAYRGRIVLGVSTDTQDGEGDVLSRRDASGVTITDIESAAARFVGDILQVPPMVSAIKRDGTPLYELARKGLRVEREPRPITVHALRITRFDPPTVDFEIECSKGTYVRTIAADLGEVLGVGAHLHALERTRVGRFDIDMAERLDVIEGAGEGWLRLGIAPLEALPELDVVRLDEAQAERVMDGGAVVLNGEQADGVATERARLTEDGSTLLAVARVSRGERGAEASPEKVFSPPI
jgi:tRNA pseudouridine55 synthase